MKLRGKKLFAGILTTIALSAMFCATASAKQVAVYHIDPNTGLLDPNYTIEEREDVAVARDGGDFNFSQALTTSFSPLTSSGSSVYYMGATDNKITITMDSYTKGRTYYFKLRDNTRNKELVTIDNFKFSLPESEIDLANYGGNYTVRLRVSQGTANVSGTIKSSNQ